MNDKTLVKEKCIHEGHRLRLTETVSIVGLEGLSKIQVMEYILFFIFPRGDVNPLAHRLLDRFNDIPTILEASVEDLKQVRGMGDASAKKLHSLLEIFFYYSFEKTFNKGSLKTIGDFYDHLEQILRYKQEEELYLFGVNNCGEIIKGRRYGSGTTNFVGLQLKEIALFISTYKVSAAFIVHNHPNGLCVPSAQDKKSFEDLKGMFKLAGCKLADSIIVGSDGIYSMINKRYARVFSEGLEYVQSLYQESQTQKKLVS